MKMIMMQYSISALDFTWVFWHCISFLYRLLFVSVNTFFYFNFEYSSAVNAVQYRQ
jgi:hypothetical protein